MWIPWNFYLTWVQTDLMILVFRMISDEHEDFLREFEVGSRQSFFEFHKAIQENLGYDESQIASFFLCNEQWEKLLEITLIGLSDEESGDLLLMDREAVGFHVKDLKQKLLYVFDIFNERAFFIELYEKKEPTGHISYPKCTASKGEPPPQIMMDRIFTGGNLANLDEEEERWEDDYSDPEDFDFFDPGPEGGDQDDND